jgi:hypothetical protein
MRRWGIWVQLGIRPTAQTVPPHLVNSAFPLLPGTRGGLQVTSFQPTKVSPYRPLLASYLEPLKISAMISHRELHSLGIRTNGTSKRKRNRPSEKSNKRRNKIPRINASDLSAPAMNPSSDIFVEFSAKIRLVLECPDRDVILHALRDLAEGRAASMLGTVVDPLSGLGQQTSGNVSNSNYREAMTTLLTWGVRNYLVEPSINAIDLWTSMSILDGPKGYAQR